MKRGFAAQPEINITPLIDILLVLLVIFMAAVTLTQQGIESTLPPEAKAGPGVDNQIVLEVDANRQLAVNRQAVTAAQLGPFLQRVYRDRHDKTLYLSASGSLPYGAIVSVMDTAKGAGVQRLGVITEGMRRSAK